MAGENSIVNVNISVADAVPSAPDFGTVMVVADVGGAFLGVKQYSADTDGLNSMVDDDGIDIDNWAYRILAAFAAGNPGIQNVKVYARSAPNVQSVELTPTKTTEGFVYAITINGVEVTYTVGAASTVDIICDALEALIDVIPGVTCTPDNATATKLVLAQAASSERFTIRGVSKGLTLKDISTDAGIAAELAAAIIEDSEWDHLVIDSNSKAEILAANTFAAANDKIFWAHTIDSEVLTGATTDVAGSLVTAGAQSTALLHSYDTETQGVYSGVSSYLTYHPGAANVHAWAMIALGDARNLTPAEVAFADSKHVIVLTTLAGVKSFRNNRTGSGRVITTQQALIYLSKVMRNDVLALQLSQPKIEFSPIGITQIENVMRKRLKLEEDAGLLLVGSSDVQPKLYENTTLVERASGLLDSMKFTGTLAVSIDRIVIKGSLTL